MSITVGSPAIDRALATADQYTYLEMNNPANGSGTLNKVTLWANLECTDCIVGTFYNTGGWVYKCRASQNIGTVAPGEAKEVEVSIAVMENDLIGFYASVGRLERDSSGYDGNLRLPGSHISPGDEEEYSVLAGDAFSLNGAYEPPAEVEGAKVIIIG